MDEAVKHYADALFEKSVSESAKTLRDDRTRLLQLFSTRRETGNLPLSGGEIQSIANAHVQHIDRCMAARVESFQKAFSEAERQPSSQDLEDVLREAQQIRVTQIGHASHALRDLLRQSGREGDLTENLTAQSAHGHERVLQNWKVWRRQTELKRASTQARSPDDPFPTRPEDVSAEIDYWAARQTEGQPGSEFDQRVRRRLEHLRFLHDGHLRQSNTHPEPPSAGGKSKWSRSEKLTGAGVAIAALAIVVSLFFPEVRRALHLEGPRDTQPHSVNAPFRPATVQALIQPTLQSTLRGRSASSARQLRSEDHVARIRETESGQTLPEVAPGSYGFASSVELVPFSPTKTELRPYGTELDFEIHKLADGRAEVIAFVGSETLDSLRRGMRAGEKFTMYSDSWREAQNAVAIPLAEFTCERRRMIEWASANKKPRLVQALDCEAPVLH